MCAFDHRWCGWHFNHDGEGNVGSPWCCCMAYSANISVRQGYISYFLVLLLKIYVLCFQNVYVLLKGTLVVSDFALAQRFQRRFQASSRFFFKKVIIHILCFRIWCFITWLWFSFTIFEFSLLQTGRFLFTPSFIEHVILLTPFFPFFQVKYCPLQVVVVYSLFLLFIY